MSFGRRAGVWEEAETADVEQLLKGGAACGGPPQLGGRGTLGPLFLWAVYTGWCWERNLGGGSRHRRPLTTRLNPLHYLARQNSIVEKETANHLSSHRMEGRSRSVWTRCPCPVSPCWACPLGSFPGALQGHTVVKDGELTRANGQLGILKLW